jgi:predicted metal-dependent hydrolase
MKVKQLLNEVMEKLNLNKDLKIKVKPLKRKVASISLRTGTLYLNELCLEILTEEEIKFVIAHELLHLKHGKFHTYRFEQELKTLFGKNLTHSINQKIQFSL